MWPWTRQVLENGTDLMREQAGYCLTALTAAQETKAAALTGSIMMRLLKLLDANQPLHVKTASASALSELHKLLVVASIATSYPIHEPWHALASLSVPSVSMTNASRQPDGSNACKETAVQMNAVDALIPLLQVRL